MIHMLLVYLANEEGNTFEYPIRLFRHELPLLTTLSFASGSSIAEDELSIDELSNDLGELAILIPWPHQRRRRS